MGELTDSDAVILWRTTWSAEIRTIFRRAWQSGARVIFDVDDLMVDPDMATLDTIDGIRTQGLTEDAVRGMYSLVRRCAETADACICTTSELATPLRRMGKITHVVPNGFDDETYVRSRLAVRRQASGVSDGLCRIGYASGSRTHQRDFATMAEPVAEVMRAHAHTRLVLFRNAFDLDEFPMFDDLRDQIEWRDIVPLADLPSELARLDVNLAPLEAGNPFCEAKSDLKYFEAALVDVPTVASPTGPFRRAIDHGVTGFLADSEDECRSALEKLVVDADLRRTVGRAAHDAVVFSHGPERRAQRIKAVLDQVLDHGANAADAFAVEVTRREPPDPAPPALAPVRTAFERDRLRPSRVTVVVPVYNYAGTVVEALDSVKAQTLEDLDLIVVEDDSPDDSLAVVAAWAEENAERFNRILVLSHVDNAGLACTRNRGFEEAETPYVLPLDADNILLPDCAASLLEALEASGAAFAYPHIRQFGPEVDPEQELVMGHTEYTAARLLAMNYIDAMALVRRSAWRAAGGYRLGLLGWEDYEIWCSFAELGLYGLRVSHAHALYRVHGDSMLRTVTHTGDKLDRAREAITDLHPWLEVDTEGAGDRPVAGAAEAPADPIDIDDPLARHAFPLPVVALTSPAVDGAPAARTRARARLARPRPPGARRAGRPQRRHDPRAAGGSGRVRAEDDGRLSERARTLLPILRCPETGEPLEEAPEGGLRSVTTGRVWPVVAGRPVLFPGMPAPEVIAPDHLGNELAGRAQELITDASGLVLHLSGGGTVAPRRQRGRRRRRGVRPHRRRRRRPPPALRRRDVRPRRGHERVRALRRPAGGGRQAAPAAQARRPGVPAHRLHAAAPRGAAPLLQHHPLRARALVRRLRDGRPRRLSPTSRRRSRCRGWRPRPRTCWPPTSRPQPRPASARPRWGGTPTTGASRGTGATPTGRCSPASRRRARSAWRRASSTWAGAPLAEVASSVSAMDGCPPADEVDVRAVLVADGYDPDSTDTAVIDSDAVSVAGDLVLTRDATLSAREVAARSGADLDKVLAIYHHVGVLVPDVDATQFSEADVDFVVGMLKAGEIGITIGLTGGDALLRVVAGSIERIAEAAVAVYVQGPEQALRRRTATAFECARANAEANELALGLGGEPRSGVPPPHAPGDHPTACHPAGREPARAGPAGDRVRRPRRVDRAAGRPRPGRARRPGQPVRGAGVRRDRRRWGPAREVHRRRDHGGRDRPGGGRPHPGRPRRCVHRRRHPAPGGMVFGEVLFRHGDYYGPVVNLAARLVDAAIPGEALVDRSVVEALKDDDDLTFEPAGRRMLKGFDVPVGVWSLAPGC